MIKSIFTALAVIALGTSVAIAEEHGHDHGAKHGGIVQHVGHHHLELVAKDGSLALYVNNEDGADEDASAAKAQATVLAGGKTETVALASGGGNKLEGSGSFTAGPGTIVVITLNMPDHEPEQARFKIE